MNKPNANLNEIFVRAYSTRIDDLIITPNIFSLIKKMDSLDEHVILGLEHGVTFGPFGAPLAMEWVSDEELP